MNYVLFFRCSAGRKSELLWASVTQMPNYDRIAREGTVFEQNYTPHSWPSAMDDMLRRVPLIIRCPGCPVSHRIKELTQSFDIFPTVLDFENVQIRHDQFGLSLRRQLEGETGDPTDQW